MIALLLGVALASEPVCGGLTAPGETLSVAWVSPLGQRVGPRGTVEVVRTRDLRAALQDRAGGQLGRMLQLLGLRRSAAPPSRRWKVTVFDVRGADLCRPLADLEAPVTLEGVPSCARDRTRSRTDGCGFTVDRADGSRGLEIFRVRWADAARDGFCVLPAQRFVDEAARPSGR